MRVIIIGIGAIGGTLAAALSLAGTEVVGVARGAQLDAVRRDGLTLRQPGGVRNARFSCVGGPDEITFRPDDAVILATKTQDSAAALDQLRAAGLTKQPLFCAQNGVENERLALRRFANVHAVTLLMPTDYLTPGEVVAFGAPKIGILDIGRAPSGQDGADQALTDLLNSAGFAAFVSDTVMDSKYGKLLMNLANIADAALGPDTDTAEIREVLRLEGIAVLARAGITWLDRGDRDPRRAELLNVRPVEGVKRAGSSSTQSLLRGTGSIESDYLNGEIVLLGRQHGVPTPANAWFCDLAARMVRERLAPGSVPLATVRAALGL